MFLPLNIQTPSPSGVALSLAASQVMLMPASHEHSPYMHRVAEAIGDPFERQVAFPVHDAVDGDATAVVGQPGAGGCN